MFPCERVDVGFVDTAPFRFRNSVEPAITPEQLFEVLGDAEAIPGGCRLTWTTAQKPAGAARVAMFAVAPLLNLALRRFLRNLRSYTDSRFAAAQRK